MVSCKTVKTNGTSPQAAFGRISHSHPRRQTDKEEIFVILRTSVRFETQSTHTTTSALAFAERSSFFLLQRRVYATSKDYSVASLTLLGGRSIKFLIIFLGKFKIVRHKNTLNTTNAAHRFFLLSSSRSDISPRRRFLESEGLRFCREVVRQAFLGAEMCCF